MGKQGSPGDWPSRHTHEAGFPSAGQIEAAASLPDHPVLCLATVADAEIHTEGGVVHLSPPPDPTALEKEVPWPDAPPPQRPCQPRQIKCSPPLPGYSPSSPFCRQALAQPPVSPASFWDTRCFPRESSCALPPVLYHTVMSVRSSPQNRLGTTGNRSQQKKFMNNESS